MKEVVVAHEAFTLEDSMYIGETVQLYEYDNAIHDYLSCMVLG